SRGVESAIAGWSSLRGGRDRYPRSRCPDPTSPPFRLLFATFKRTGSAWATVKYFREQELLFPRRVRIGPHAGELHWMPLQHNAVLKVLRNPRSAGAFCGLSDPYEQAC